MTKDEFLSTFQSENKRAFTFSELSRYPLLIQICEDLDVKSSFEGSQWCEPSGEVQSITWVPVQRMALMQVPCTLRDGGSSKTVLDVLKEFSGV